MKKKSMEKGENIKIIIKKSNSPKVKKLKKPCFAKANNEPKEKIFLTKKRQRSQENNYFFNNQINQSKFNFMNEFNNKSIFKNHEERRFPIIFNNYFFNFPIRPNFNKQSPVTLIINNYHNLDKSEEEIQINENIFKTPLNSKSNKIESPSTSTTNTIIANPVQKENLFQKNKFNVIKDNSGLNHDENPKIKINKKRGRKASKIGKRQHSALDQDNIIRKIQVHYITFIISFINDVIQTVFNNNNKNTFFKSIKYECKKTVNHSYIQELFSKNIGEIVQLGASPKNKKFDENINRIIYDKLCNIELFKKLFDISYLDMFNKYYYQDKREFDVFGYKVNLSSKTKLFFDLLQKNETSAGKIKEICEEYFLNKKKDPSQIFVIEKNQSENK